MPLAAQIPIVAQAIVQAIGVPPPGQAQALAQWTAIVTQIYQGIATGALVTPILVAPPTGGPCVGTCTIE